MNRQITNFMDESDRYIAPEVEMVEIEANNRFLSDSGVDAGGDAGTGEAGGEF